MSRCIYNVTMATPRMDKMSCFAVCCEMITSIEMWEELVAELSKNREGMQTLVISLVGYEQETEREPRC